MGMGFFLEDENILKFIVMMVAQIYECVKNHEIVRFK